jgi:hypothetical protein
LFHDIGGEEDMAAHLAGLGVADRDAAGARLVLQDAAGARDLVLGDHYRLVAGDQGREPRRGRMRRAGQTDRRRRQDCRQSAHKLAPCPPQRLARPACKFFANVRGASDPVHNPCSTARRGAWSDPASAALAATISD